MIWSIIFLCNLFIFPRTDVYMYTWFYIYNVEIWINNRPGQGP
jgi:hypothetical protein